MAKLPDDDFSGDSFIGVMANCVWQLRQEGNQLMYRVLGELTRKNHENYYNQVRIKISVPPLATNGKKKPKESGRSLLHADEYYESLLKAYFRLNVDLSECYSQWTTSHKHFESQSSQFYAIRQLDQDPVENLFSFICSQNNHISR